MVLDFVERHVFFGRVYRGAFGSQRVRAYGYWNSLALRKSDILPRSLVIFILLFSARGHTLPK